MQEFAWNVRDYEMSVWTLQDNYITTLKSADGYYELEKSSLMSWPRTRYRGQVQNGQMTLNMDGTQKLTFDIPMYIEVEGKRIENPNWYTTQDKNTLVAMRKIKVIFDKMAEGVDKSKETFEFIILKVEETHEHDNCTCHVECEGLAFHELGKVGYKISLTKEDYNNDYYEWGKTSLEDYTPTGGMTAEELKEKAKPLNNIDYWLRKAGIEKSHTDIENNLASKWYYRVEMSQSGYTVNTQLISDVIYEEAVITDWHDDKTIDYMGCREKLCLVDLKESNLYNITQDLAEAFGVFCRYEYTYDDNYCITGRCIVFYNNYLKEEDNPVSFLYPDNAQKISRTMDSTDITTKMFVRSVVNDALYKGTVSIMDCNANYSKEDYLLNFDYLKEIGTISKEQYDYIKKYEDKMRSYNNKIVPLQESIAYLQQLKISAEAKYTTYKESVALDEERITENAALANALDEGDGDADGYITIDYRNPDTLFVLKNTENPKYDVYYVQLNQNGKLGVDEKSLRLFKTYKQTSTIASKTFGFTTTKLASEKTSSDKKNIIVQDILSNVNGITSQTLTTSENEPFFPNFVTYFTSGSSLTGNDAKVKGSYYIYNGTFPIIQKLDNVDVTIYPDDIMLYNNLNKWERIDSKYGLHLSSGKLEISYKGQTTSSEVILANVTDGDMYQYTGENTTIGEAFDIHKNDYIYHYNGKNYILDEDTARKKGYGLPIYLWQKTVVSQLNGCTNTEYKLEKEHLNRRQRDNSISLKKHVNLIRQLYYVDNIAPDKPTKKTTIKTTDAHGEWTTYLPQIGDTDRLFTCLQCSFSSGNPDYRNIAAVASPAVTEITGSTLTSYKTAQTAAGDSILTDEITDYKITHDESTHVATGATNLFVVKKSGSYYNYCTISGNVPTIEKNETNIIDKFNALVGLADSWVTEHPVITDTRYVLIRDDHYYAEGGPSFKRSNYLVQYYKDGVIDTPENKDTQIVSARVVFYISKATEASQITQPTNDKYEGWSETAPARKNKKYNVFQCYKIQTRDDKLYFTPVSKITNYKIHKAEEDTAIPTYIYATYRYKPDLYYEQIKESWVKKLDADQGNMKKFEKKKDKLNTLLTSTEEEDGEKIGLQPRLEDFINKQNEQRHKFERVMGPALRESYWQPDEGYQDYGTKYSDTILKLPSNDELREQVTNIGNQLQYSFFRKNSENYASFGWDGAVSDDEQQCWYEYSINQIKKYYPCIEVTNLSKKVNGETVKFLDVYAEAMKKDQAVPFSVFFNPNTDTIPSGSSQEDVRYSQAYTFGAGAQLVVLYDTKNYTTTEPIRPRRKLRYCILLTDATTLSDTELKNLQATWRIGQLSMQEIEVQNSDIPEYRYTYAADTYFNPGSKRSKYYISKTVTEVDDSGNDTDEEDTSFITNCCVVYPRIRIPSLKLKTGSDELTVKLVNPDNPEEEVTLQKYQDYYLSVRSYKRVNDAEDDGSKIKVYRNLYDDQLRNIGKDLSTFSSAYTITIKPELLFKYYGWEAVSIYYSLSNADLNIYMDGKKVLKENAYPKVSYDIDTIFWKSTFNNQLYNKLAQIIMINDTDLKFENVFGYISEITIDLDHQDRDTIEVKNYKTKFEDLFSKIVAQTEEMHKNEHNISLAGGLQAGSGTGIGASLNQEAFQKTIEDSSEILTKFLNEYFDGENIVRQQLQGMWNEAGAILGSAAQSLNDVMNLTTQNASILAGFRENVAAAFTPTVFTGPNPPVNYKAGDIWKNGLYEGVATSSMGGFTRTHDGQLAALHGQAANIDVQEGTIDITAPFAISLRSGDDIYIAANDDVSIVGNNTVNIGGSTINIASVYKNYIQQPGDVIAIDDDEGNSGSNIGGIHLLASYVNWNSEEDEWVSSDTDATSLVDITGEGITLASKNGIIIKSGAGINIKSSTDTNVSVIDIDNQKGIWMGSDKKLVFFSGGYSSFVNENGEISIDENGNVSGANVELSPQHLLLGVANTQQANGTATAIELSAEQVIIAAGSNLNAIKIQNGRITDFSEANLSGVQIQKDYIGLATGGTVQNGNPTPRSIVAIDPKKVVLGQITASTSNPSTPEQYNGSFLWLAEQEIYMAGMGALTINTNNIKIQSKVLDNPKAEAATTNTATSNTSNAYKAIPSTMGFALGKNLNGNNPTVGLGFWLDKSNHSHFIVNGSNAFFTITEDELGIYKRNTSTNTADGLLWFEDGDLWLKGVLHVGNTGSDIKIYDGSGQPTGFTDYITETLVTTDLIDDKLTATDYYKLLQGNFSGWNTEHNDSQTFWSNLQGRWNAIDGGVQSTITIQNLNQNVIAIQGGASSDITLNSLNSQAISVINGDVGLAFSGSGKATYVGMDKDLGLIIIGDKLTQGDYNNKYPFFRVTHDAMGFFTTNTIPDLKTVANDPYQHLSSAPAIVDRLLYFENGDLALKGTMYAKTGWFGGATGWVIASNELKSADYAVKNGVEIPQFLLKTIAGLESGSTSPLFQLTDNTGAVKLLFKNGTLEVSGTVKAANGWFGGEQGWIISNNEIKSYTSDVILQSKAANSNYTTAVFQLGSDSNNPVLLFKNGALQVAGTIHASGGWLGTATNGWIIGTDVYNGIDVGRIQSANGKLILSAGTSTGSQQPFIVLKNSSNVEVFKVQDGEISITGTINANGGWFGNKDGWVIGGNATIDDVITTITIAGESTSFTQTGSRIQSANNKIIINAGNNDANNPMEPYMIMRKSGINGTLENVFEYINGNISLKGAIYAGDGQIGGWSISASAITSGSSTNTVCLSTDSNSNYRIWAGYATADETNTPFYVKKDGTIKATKATIEGSVTATSGKIANWHIIGSMLLNADTYANATIGLCPVEDTNWQSTYSLPYYPIFVKNSTSILFGVDADGGIKSKWINMYDGDISMYDSTNNIRILHLAVSNGKITGQLPLQTSSVNNPNNDTMYSARSTAVFKPTNASDGYVFYAGYDDGDAANVAIKRDGRIYGRRFVIRRITTSINTSNNTISQSASNARALMIYQINKNSNDQITSIKLYDGEDDYTITIPASLNIKYTKDL